MGVLPNTLLVLALSSFVGLSSAQQNPGTINITFPEHPPPVALTNVVKDNYLGISWELSSFDTLWGFTADQLPIAMENYLHNIRARISSPLRIRIGGNGMDISTYDPDKTDNMLELTDPDAYFNDIPCRFGPVFFDVLNTMSERVGEMSYIIGLPFRQPEFYDNAVILAKAAQDSLGDKLDALLLGNEPDLYQKHGHKENFGVEDYVPDIGDIIELLKDAGVNTSLIGGPTVCCNWNIDDVIQGGLDQYHYKYYTYQQYPTHACQGLNDKNTNMTYFATHSNVKPYIQWQDGNVKGVIEAKEEGIPVLMTEFNSISCGGSNISDTFAMALWGTDAALGAATLNISGMFLHTREFDITYNLFNPPSAHDPTKPGWRTGPIYYTTLVVAETLSATGSVVVDLNLNSSHAVAYGVYDDSGETRGKLVFINYASERSNIPAGVAGRNTTTTFRIPANVTGSIGVRYLLSTDLYSGSRMWDTEDETITWAGQTVGDVGDLQGEQHTEFIDCGEGCTVDVPGPGLALVYMLGDTSDRFFHGNSTIALPSASPEDDSSGLRSYGMGNSGPWVWAGCVLSIAIGWLW